MVAADRRAFPIGCSGSIVVAGLHTSRYSAPPPQDAASLVTLSLVLVAFVVAALPDRDAQRAS